MDITQCQEWKKWNCIGLDVSAKDWSLQTYLGIALCEIVFKHDVLNE